MESLDDPRFRNASLSESNFAGSNGQETSESDFSSVPPPDVFAAAVKHAETKNKRKTIRLEAFIAIPSSVPGVRIESKRPGSINRHGTLIKYNGKTESRPCSQIQSRIQPHLPNRPINAEDGSRMDFYEIAEF
jgi:hypothetical protein